MPTNCESCGKPTPDGSVCACNGATRSLRSIALDIENDPRVLGPNEAATLDDLADALDALKALDMKSLGLIGAACKYEIRHMSGRVTLVGADLDAIAGAVDAITTLTRDAE